MRWLYMDLIGKKYPKAFLIELQSSLKIDTILNLEEYDKKIGKVVTALIFIDIFFIIFVHNHRKLHKKLNV